MPDRAHNLETLDRLLESSHRTAVDSPHPPIRRREIAEQLVSLLAPDSFAADQYRTLRMAV